MCGILGWLAGSDAVDVDSVQSMLTGLRHRGPDAGAIKSLGPVALGHARLSVIDTSHASDQPYTDTTGRYTLVYNGEIYNYRELRAELLAQGVNVRTQGDTEVVLEAYKRWGVDCLTRFNGMFAFAIWDAERRYLFLARDRLGKKPLYYARRVDGGFVFASELEAMRGVPGLDFSPNPIAMAQFLALNYVLGDRTLAQGVSSLPAAHWLGIDGEGRLECHCYWDLARCFREKPRYRSQSEAAEALRELLDDAVRLRLVSDVPLGAFLSGGIDSSAIVAAMARVQDPGQVLSFTMAFDDERFNETAAARAAATHFGVRHHEQLVCLDADALIESIQAAAAAPLADSSAIPTYFLSRYTRQHVTVALSGDGGDECFAGYVTYVADRLYRAGRWVPNPVLGALQAIATRLAPVRHAKVGLDYKLRQFLGGLRKPWPHAHGYWRAIFDTDDLRDLMSRDFQSACALDNEDAFVDEYRVHLSEVSECHWLDQASYIDIKTWLVDDILVKLDRMSMAHSLEARAPFLDYRMVEFAAGLPPAWRLRGFNKKHLLKASQRERLPEWILSARKQGFNAPISSWLLGPLRDFARETLASPELTAWLQPAAIDRLWREHEAHVRDNGLRLFGLVCLALWLRKR